MQMIVGRGPLGAPIRRRDADDRGIWPAR